MSSSVSVLFHTSFPSPTLGWLIRSWWFTLWEFLSKLVSFSGDATQALSGLQLGSTQPWNISVWSSHSRKPKALAGSDRRPLAQAFRCEGNRSSCWVFLPLSQHSVLRWSRSPEPRRLWADGKKTQMLWNCDPRLKLSQTSQWGSQNLKQPQGIPVSFLSEPQNSSLPGLYHFFAVAGQQCLQLPLTSSRKSLMKNAWLLIISFYVPLVVAIIKPDFSETVLISSSPFCGPLKYICI